MKTLPLILVLGMLVLLIGVMVWVLIGGWRRHSRNRFRIMTAGVHARATVTRIEPADRSGATVVHFTLVPESGARAIAGRQPTTRAAVDALHLQAGSGLDVRFLAKHPHVAFSDTLARAERDHTQAGSRDPADEPVAFYYVSYNHPATHLESSRTNNLGWYGAGELMVSRRAVRFKAGRLFHRGPVERSFALTSVVDVEQLGPVIRLQLYVKGRHKRLQFWALDAREAARIAQSLPATRTARYAPALSDSAAFLTTLLSVTPKTPVTQALVGINVLMFVIATMLGGGFLVPDPATMIELGTDYTPLTLGGQWWRLITSVFLHFGLLHLVFNMWALRFNGAVAERLYGPVRYLVIYLIAGLSGSLASLLWHPVVNGAGASGAIFGILGALIAFFLRRRQDLPRSVFKAQITGTSAFVLYNLAFGARGGIDNAAHLGGLMSGFLMGLLLARPLTIERDARSWTAQWTLAATTVASLTLLFATLLSSGRLAPRRALDSAGREIPVEGIVVVTQSLQGVKLGMTAEQLLPAKGPPIRKPSPQEWLYNTIDARHDGVLSVQFGKPGTTREGTIDVLEYFGDRESAPPELPFLKNLTVSDLTQKYGEPASKVAVDGGTTFLWFSNGIIVGIRDGKVDRYGIFDYRMVGNQ